MKRFNLILATALFAALVCWWIIPSRTANFSAGNSAQQTGTHCAAKALETVVGKESVLSAATPSDADALKATFEATQAASVLARTPKGAWTKRAPSIDDYAAEIPAAHAPALAEFRARFPELDPSDVQDFSRAYRSQRDTYGNTLDEDESELFNAWLEPMAGMQKAAVIARAALVGVVLRGSEPLDLEGNSRDFLLTGFQGVDPRYVYTANAAAAESTGANLVRLSPSYDALIPSPADGTGLYVNVNDSGLIYEHPEFQLPSGGSRIIYKDSGSSNNNHATHVAGTIGCWGYNSNLMGMAPRVWLRSFQNFYFSRGVSSHGMMWPGQKHSDNNPNTGEAEMKSVVSSASLITFKGGHYSVESAIIDSSLRDYPYLTYFFGAGNDGSAYKTVASDLTSCKNGVTIGSVADTVRDDSGAYVSGGGISSFSSRGPTMDGRIKPDLTANGAGLTSPWSATTTASKSGTSMATPNASGSAALLIDYITRKLPGHFFRSSTIKALLTNTATDRGKAGPDYTYGHGIVNVKAAADIVKRYAENPSTRVVLEDTLSSGQTWTQTYTYDGAGPIRLTLAWIDPAGSPIPSAESGTNHSPNLVNDLNVRLIKQGGSTYEPFVMPFTTGDGTDVAYSTNLYSATAVTGNNFTDNIEQILVATPPAGTYTVQVTHTGALIGGNDQPFSIAITGLSGDAPLVPALSSISPSQSPHIGDAPDNFIVTLDGSGFVLGSDVLLRRDAANGTTEEAKGYGIIPVANQIIARFDLATLTPGYWDVVVRTSDGTESILPNGFLISAPVTRTTLYANDFESGDAGLSTNSEWAVADPNKGSVSGPTDAQQGSNALVTYPGTNYPADAYASVRTPEFSTIGYTDIRLEFQHWLGLGAGDEAAIWYRIGFGGSSIKSYRNINDTGWSAQSHTLNSATENQSALRIEFQLDSDAASHSFGWNIDDLKITAVDASAPVTDAPRFTSTAITAATQGQAYSYAITTADADTADASLVLAASGLPSGISFTPDGSGGGTLSGTPTVNGTFPVQISVTDGSYTTYQNFSLEVTATLIADPGSNPDGDHRNNLMEFAFGTDPTLMDMGPLAIDGTRHGDPMMQAADGGGFELYFIRRVNHAAEGITYTACFSNDLVNFEDSLVMPVVVESAISGGYELVKVPFPTTPAARFGCVRVEMNP